jgi:UDP-N-acetylglucosamine 2-epimerase (non-hydrolysing)
LVGTDPDKILAAYREVKNGGSKMGDTPPLWDGCAAERIISILDEC